MDNLMEELIELRELLPNEVWIIIPPIVINHKLCIRAEWYLVYKHSFEMCFSHSEIKETNICFPKVFAGNVQKAWHESVDKEKAILR